MHNHFTEKKEKILRLLDVPSAEYNDLSPKGSIDEPIRELIDEINRLHGLVTTSSCSGRISVFLEGSRKSMAKSVNPGNEEIARAGPGGKGGGSWLFVSHDPVEIPGSPSDCYFQSKFGFGSNKAVHTVKDHVEGRRYIHLKFEPMILHILTASSGDAQKVLTASSGAGFRESGAMTLTPTKDGELNPLIAVRSTGIAFDAIIGYQTQTGENICLVDESYLRILNSLANERFHINQERISRFRSSLLAQYDKCSLEQLDEPARKGSRIDWEDSDRRKTRKRKEGLARQQALQMQATAEGSENAANNAINIGISEAFKGSVAF